MLRIIRSAAGRFLVAGAIVTGIVLLTRRPFPRGRSLWGAMLYGAVGFAASRRAAATARFAFAVATVTPSFKRVTPSAAGPALAMQIRRRSGAPTPAVLAA